MALNKNMTVILLSVIFLSSFLNSAAQNQTEYDIVIYGGTSAGIAAGIQGSRMGKSVVLIEPTSRIGGLTTGGLGQTDIGNKQVIGGIAGSSIRTSRLIMRYPIIGIGRKKRSTGMADKPEPLVERMPCGLLSRLLR